VDIKLIIPSTLYTRFGQTCCYHLQGRSVMRALVVCNMWIKEPAAVIGGTPVFL